MMAGELLRLCVRCDVFAPRVVREAITALPDLGRTFEDALLVATELVSNAVKHSLCSEDELLTVSVRRDGWLRIAVIDPGGASQARIVDRPIGLGGLGLKVVDALSRSWGAERHEDGYEVWAELDLIA